MQGCQLNPVGHHRLRLSLCADVSMCADLAATRVVRTQALARKIPRRLLFRHCHGTSHVLSSPALFLQLDSNLGRPYLFGPTFSGDPLD